MSENGNGKPTGLQAMFASEDDELEIKLLADGEDVGLSFFFKAVLDARTDKQYSHILQKSTRQKQSTIDEANRYVFEHRFLRSVGFDESGLRYIGCSDADIELFKSNENLFFRKCDKVWRLTRTGVVTYLNEVQPDADASKSRGA